MANAIEYYMAVLIGTVIIMGYVIPNVESQSDVLTECEGVHGGNCSNESALVNGTTTTIIDLYSLILALTLLLLFMRPLLV